MKYLNLLSALVLFASCQSISSTDSYLKVDSPVKIVEAGINFSPTITTNDWYSEINELEKFEQYQEENGILLGKKHSVGTYFDSENYLKKLIVLEEIKHLPNGEANFRKLDLIEIILNTNQFLTTSFCSKEGFDDIPILAVYENGHQSKKIIQAWEIQLDDYKLESIAVKNLQCTDEF